MTATFDRRRIAGAAYTAGATTREIAEGMGVSATTVARWVGELRRTGPRGRTDVQDGRIVALRDSGLSWSAVAREVGMSKTGVQHRYWLATRGARRDRPKGAATAGDGRG